MTITSPPKRYNERMYRRHRLARRLPLTVAAALTGALIAACGASQQPNTTARSSSNQKFTANAAYQYADCMRAHGVSNFQDPQVSTQGNHQAISIQITPAIVASPAFKVAQKACGHLLPDATGSSPSQLQDHDKGLLAFAKCMRSHGFQNFPDPSPQGQLTLQAITRAGINLHQPALLKAGDACTSVSDGQITKADVAQAVTGATANGPQQSSSG